MTDYAGTLVLPKTTEVRLGRREGNERANGRDIICTDQAHGGTHSLRIESGGYHDVWYGCDAGVKTISVWVRPPIAGRCALQIFKAADVVGEAFNVGSGAWEQVSVTFMAIKFVYIARLINFGPANGDMRCYFDDLV